MSTTATLPSVTANQILGEYAQEALTAVDSMAKPAIISMISTGEATAEKALGEFLKNLPKPTGLAGVIAGPIEAAFAAAAESYAKKAVAQYGPDAIFALLDAQLHTWAKLLGG